MAAVEPDSKASYVLSNLAEVVERILAFLPAKALLRAACVCRLWRECSRRLLRTQQNFTWVSNVVPHDGNNHALIQALEEELEKVQVLPQTVFYIADTETFSGCIEYHRDRKKARRRHSKKSALALEKLLPTRCQVLGLGTPGIVATPTGSRRGRPVEVEYGEAGFALLFPKMDGVKIQTFRFLKDPKSKAIDEDQFAEAGLKNNPDLRVVLLFGYNTWNPGATRFLHQIVNRLNEKSIILAGGHVDGFTSPTSDNNNQSTESCGIVGLSFSGPQIQSAAILLDQDVVDEKTAEAAMQRLKAAGIPEHNTVGFMFACVGRGSQHYKTEQYVEADAFRKLFPSVPLFGFFGHGEIGCDRIVTGNFILRECNNIKDDLLHSYTTVMTLVHLG